MRVFDNTSGQMVDLPNEILLSLHSYILHWMNDLLRNELYLVRKRRVYIVEFPLLSQMFDQIFDKYLTFDLTEFSKNIDSITLKPCDLQCEDVEEEVSGDAVKYVHRIYPFRKLPILKPFNYEKKKK